MPTIGQLAPRLKADLPVLGAQRTDPHRSLLANHPQDLEMVWVGGELLYGRAFVLQAVKPNQCEELEVSPVPELNVVAEPTSVEHFTCGVRPHCQRPPTQPVAPAQCRQALCYLERALAVDFWGEDGAGGDNVAPFQSSTCRPETRWNSVVLGDERQLASLGLSGDQDKLERLLGRTWDGIRVFRHDREHGGRRHAAGQRPAPADTGRPARRASP